MITHPVFIRPLGDKAILVTIVDMESIGIEGTVDCFAIAQTEKNLSGVPTIKLNPETILTVPRYIKLVDDTEFNNLEDTTGMSIDGILKSGYWFIRKYKSTMEKILGL